MNHLRSRTVEQSTLSSPLRILAVADGLTPVRLAVSHVEINLQKAIGPQISQIYADGSGCYPASSQHLKGELRTLPTLLFYLR
jgi:hypothetical protein